MTPQTYRVKINGAGLVRKTSLTNAYLHSKQISIEIIREDLGGSNCGERLWLFALKAGESVASLYQLNTLCY